MHDGAPKTIGLLDHMGYGNLGDAAIQIKTPKKGKWGKDHAG